MLEISETISNGSKKIIIIIHVLFHVLYTEIHTLVHVDAIII